MSNSENEQQMLYSIHIPSIRDIILYSIYYGHDGTSSSVSDVVRYFIIRNLFHTIFNIIPIFIRGWEIHTQQHRTFLLKAANTNYDVAWLVEEMEFIRLVCQVIISRPMWRHYTGVGRRDLSCGG
jgi:hypothetical protein